MSVTARTFSGQALEHFLVCCQDRSALAKMGFARPGCQIVCTTMDMTLVNTSATVGHTVDKSYGFWNFPP